MIDRRALRAGDAGTLERGADTLGYRQQRSGRGDRRRRWPLNHKEPIAAVDDIAPNFAEAIVRQADIGAIHPGGYVTHRDGAVLRQANIDDTHRCFETMRAELQAPEPGERRHQTDRTMTAHAEIADIIEKNHGRGAIGLRRRLQQRADQHLRTARLVDHRRAEMVVVALQLPNSVGHAPVQLRPALQHHARRFTARMRIDHPDTRRGFVSLLHLTPRAASAAGSFPHPAPVAESPCVRRLPAPGAVRARTRRPGHASRTPA